MRTCDLVTLFFCGRCRLETNETSLTTIYFCQSVIPRLQSELGLLVSLRGQVCNLFILEIVLMTFD